jgi:hypothetical protein
MEGILQLIGSIQDKQSVSQGVQNAQSDSIGAIDDTIAPLLLIEPGSTTSTQFLNKDGTFKDIQDASTSASGIIRLIDEDDMSSNVVDRVPTQQSVKAYVTTQINSLIADAPDTLNNLNELAAALNDNPNLHQLVTANQTKLAGIEAGATADQTAAEIRTLVESASDSNVFTDADHSKLDGIEAGATADQTAADIKTLLASSKLTSDHVNIMGSANSYAAGLVLAGNATHNDEFLRKDGTWASAGGGGGGGAYSTTSLAGQVALLYPGSQTWMRGINFVGGTSTTDTSADSTWGTFKWDLAAGQAYTEYQHSSGVGSHGRVDLIFNAKQTGSNYNMTLYLRASGGAQTGAFLEFNPTYNSMGSYSAITTAAGNYSDDRMKFNERDVAAAEAEALLKKIPVKRYKKTKWIMTPEEESIFEAGGDGFASRAAEEGGNPDQWTVTEEIGSIAQELNTDPDTRFMVGNHGEAPWTVRYENMTCINTRVLQRLLERVEALEAKVN